MTDIRRSLHGSVDRNNNVQYRAYQLDIVAPFTGAWIETPICGSRPSSPASRSLHGSVDRNTEVTFEARTGSCRSLHGSVDRNDYAHKMILKSPCRSLHGSVDRNTFGRGFVYIERCRSLHGSVDRNNWGGGWAATPGESLPSRERVSSGVHYVELNIMHAV